jgi:hypothetical protein
MVAAPFRQNKNGDKQEKGRGTAPPFKKQLSLFANLDNFDALVVATLATNLMGHLEFATLRTFHQRRSLQLPNVRTAFIATGFGLFSLGYCHF